MDLPVAIVEAIELDQSQALEASLSLDPGPAAWCAAAHMAQRRSAHECLDVLLRNLPAEDVTLAPLLWGAVVGGRLGIAQKLMDLGARLFDPTLDPGDPRLHGAPMNIKSRNAALMALARGGEEKLEFLLAAMAREPGFEGDVLSLALSQDTVEGFDALLDRLPFPSATYKAMPLLSHAVRSYKVGHARVLLARGADVALQDASGMDALSEAVARNHPTMVKELLAAGASPNQLREGVSLLARAIRSRSEHAEEVGRLLVAAGAVIDQGDMSAPELVRQAKEMQKEGLAATMETVILAPQIREGAEAPRSRM